MAPHQAKSFSKFYGSFVAFFIISLFYHEISPKKLEQLLKPKAKLQQGIRTDLCQNFDKSSGPIDNKKEVAKAVGTSHYTLHKAKTIAKEKPELLKTIDTGNTKPYQYIVSQANSC